MHAMLAPKEKADQKLVLSEHINACWLLINKS
jgi:hypothetical protein